MKSLHSGRKPISLFVIVAFSAMLCFWAGQAPAAPSPGRDAGAAAGPDEGNGTGYFESEEAQPAHGKRGKFPWLVAAVVIVAGGAALYFLVLKKKNYTLTVSVGEGVTGSPAAGTQTCKKGTVINYSYAPASGYANLEVKLDNVPVANSGTVAMGANHTLTALLRVANLAVVSTPAGARIFIDGADSGRTTPYTFTYSSAVTKTVLLQNACGYQEYSQSISVAVDETKTISHAFAAGIKEDFEVPPSPCWLPYHASSWGHTGHGVYRYSGAAAYWSTSVYNHSFTGDYTAIARMFPKSGADHHPLALILGTGADMANASGYVFYYYPSFSSSGQYGIWRISNTNFINASGGSVVVLKSMTPSAAITEGLGKFNVLKVVKSGSRYSFYINNTLLHTFTDSTHAANYLALAAYCSTMPTVVEFDYVYLNPAS